MKDSNYKTTIAGIVGAIWIAIQPIITAKGFTNVDWSSEWKDLVGAAIVAALGALAKDYDITGAGVTKKRVSS